MESLDEKKSGASARLASYEKRVQAVLIDAGILLAANLPIALATGFFHRSGRHGFHWPTKPELLFFLIAVVIFLAINGKLLARHGQTVGKRIIGTRIVGLDGNLVPFARLFLLRYLLPGLIVRLTCLGGLFAAADALYALNGDRRCIHDHFAGTKVVETE